LFRDKGRSKCPGTRAEANVPGQTPLSTDVPGQNHLPKKAKKNRKRRSKTGKGRFQTGEDVLKEEKYVLKQKNLVLKQEIIGKNSALNVQN
jgi:hypothetical protein